MTHLIPAKQTNLIVLEGLRNAWFNHFWATEELDEDITPEYLVTAAIHGAFADYAKKEGLHGRLIVRCEEKTRLMTAKGRIGKWLREGNSRQLTNDSKLRQGCVDIGLHHLQNGFEEAFGVVEVKKTLKFKKCGELYKPSETELSKDLERNIRFLKQHGLDTGVIYSAFAFYLYDKTSVFKRDGGQFCRGKKDTLERYAKKALGTVRGISLEVRVETVYDDLFTCENDPRLHVDDDEPPEDHPSHTALGVISIYCDPEQR